MKVTTVFHDPHFFSIRQRLIEQFDPSKGDTLLVGIGEVGHILRDLKVEFPDHPGRLILYNLDRLVPYPEDSHNSYEVVNIPQDAPQSNDLDFFRTLVRGARAYYLRTVMHSFSPSDYDTILRHIKKAMQPGYSILLLDTVAIPESNANWMITSADRVSHAVFNGIELTDQRFTYGIRQAGFNLLGSHRSEHGWTTMYECELSQVKVESQPEVKVESQSE